MKYSHASHKFVKTCLNGSLSLKSDDEYNSFFDEYKSTIVFEECNSFFAFEVNYTTSCKHEITRMVIVL